jgi:hypothetical protein
MSDGGGSWGLATASPLRRIAAAVLTVAAIDPFVPAWLARAERSRYEDDRVFRFEHSDLFATGPVVEYLREHPRGDRPRSVFLGNSVVWGYRLPPEDSVPARFQQLEPSVRVFNFAVNGFGIVSAYLMLNAVIDAVDTVYLHVDGRQVNPGLARLIPVADEDVRRFDLEPPDRFEETLERGVGVWRLYRYSYRLQAAWFGTSTRNYLYAHKSSLLGASSGDTPTNYAANPPNSKGITVFHRVAESEPSPDRRRALADAEPQLWEYASFIRAHGKQAVFWRIDNGASDTSATWDQLNRVFQGSVAFVTVAAPAEMMVDERHLTSTGSAAVADMLHDVTHAALTPHDAVH